MVGNGEGAGKVADVGADEGKSACAATIPFDHPTNTDKQSYMSLDRIGLGLGTNVAMVHRLHC